MTAKNIFRFWAPLVGRPPLPDDLLRRVTGTSFTGISRPVALADRQGMSFQPKRAGTNGRIYADFLPPFGFIAAAVELAVVSST